jgi:hypothetical protein
MQGNGTYNYVMDRSVGDAAPGEASRDVAGSVGSPGAYAARRRGQRGYFPNT